MCYASCVYYHYCKLSWTMSRRLLHSSLHASLTSLLHFCPACAHSSMVILSVFLYLPWFIMLSVTCPYMILSLWTGVDAGHSRRVNTHSLFFTLPIMISISVRVPTLYILIPLHRSPLLPGTTYTDGATVRTSNANPPSHGSVPDRFR